MLQISRELETSIPDSKDDVVDDHMNSSVHSTSLEKTQELFRKGMDKIIFNTFYNLIFALQIDLFFEKGSPSYLCTVGLIVSVH